MDKFNVGDLVEVENATPFHCGVWFRNGDRGHVTGVVSHDRGLYDVDFKGCGNVDRRVDEDGLNWGDDEPGGVEDGVYGRGIWCVGESRLKLVEKAKEAE